MLLRIIIPKRFHRLNGVPQTELKHLAEKKSPRAGLQIDWLGEGRAFPADGTVVVRGWEADLMNAGFERIINEETSREEFACSDDVLDRLHGLERADHAANASDDASFLVRWLGMIL